MEGLPWLHARVGPTTYARMRAADTLGGSIETDAPATDSLAHIAQLNAELLALKKEEQERNSEFQELARIWEQKKNDLADEVEMSRLELHRLERALQDQRRRSQRGPPPPGPKCLSFLDSKLFITVGCCVVVANLAALSAEGTLEGEEKSSTTRIQTDHAFLMFYAIELGLKAMYHQSYFIFGSPRKVAWNWLDTVIVASGLLELLLPVVPRWTNYLRAFRLFRLLRLLRLLQILLDSDLRWADWPSFHSFMMGVIAVSAILMGLEMQYPDLNFIWTSGEHMMLVIFTLELIVRLGRGQCDFFSNSKEVVWNLLDLLSVLGGVIDLWMMPLGSFCLAAMGFHHSNTMWSSTGNVNQTMSLLRMPRLLRILRVVRLIRNVPELYNLIVGISQAMQGMIWVLVLTIVVLYVSALVAVQLVGPQGLLWPDPPFAKGEEPDPEVMEVFPGIFGAIFNLFKVMNADMDPMEPLFKAIPASKYVIMAYVVLTNWAIFSILTAVVTDQMARVTEQHEKDTSKDKKADQNRMLVDLIFQKLDHEDQGKISALSFRSLIDNEMETHELCEQGDVTPTDLHEFVDVFSKKHPEQDELVITRDGFLKGLEKEGTDVNQRSVMRLEKRFGVVEKGLIRRLSRLEDILQEGVLRTPTSVCTTAASPPAKSLLHDPAERRP